MDKDTHIFKQKSLSDIFDEIYKNTKKKERQVNSLIGELKPLIKNVHDATIVVPLIKEYLEIGVKNDEHVVKMAAIIQRLLNSTNRIESKEAIPDDFSELISEKELEEIKEEAYKSKEELNSLNESNKLTNL
jgi:hypothetical protein